MGRYAKIQPQHVQPRRIHAPSGAQPRPEPPGRRRHGGHKSFDAMTPAEAGVVIRRLWKSGRTKELFQGEAADE